MRTKIVPETESMVSSFWAIPMWVYSEFWTRSVSSEKELKSWCEGRRAVKEVIV